MCGGGTIEICCVLVFVAGIMIDTMHECRGGGGGCKLAKGTG